MTRRIRFASIGILAILMIASFLPVVPLATATNDPPNHGGGQFNQALEWDVIDTQTYTNGAIIRMDDHNVTVKKNGNLVLDKASILFNGHTNGQIGIMVEDGGTLTLKNTAMIAMWTIKTFYCIFMKGSTVSVTNSQIAGAYGGKASVNVPASTGIWVETKDFTADSSFIAGSIWGDALIINNTGNPTIRNSTIDVSSGSGVYMMNGANATFSDDIIVRHPASNGWAGIYLSSQSRAKVIKTNIKDFNLGFGGFGIQVSDSYLYANGNTFTNNYNTITIDGHASADLIANDIGGGQIGIKLWSFAQVNMIGNNIHDTAQFAIEANDFTTLNTTGLVLKHNFGGGIHLIQATANIGKATIDTFNSQLNFGILAESFSTANVTSGAFSTSDGSSMFKFTSGSTGTINSATLTGNIWMGVWSERGATVTVTKSKFDGCTNCFYAVNSGVIISSFNKFSNYQIALSSYGKGLLTSRLDMISSPQAFSITAYSSISGTVDIYSMTGDAVLPTTIWTYSVNGARIYIHDSSMTNYGTQAVVWNGYVRAINTTMKPSGVQVPKNAPAGTVEIGWYADISTTWQNDEPAPNATVDFVDANRNVQQTLMTDENGLASTEVIEVMVNKSGPHDYNTYNLAASLNGMTGRKAVDFRNNMQGPKTVTIALQDTSLPEVNITYPTEGTVLNVTDLIVNGTMSDTGSEIGGVIMQAVPGVAVGAGKTSYSGFIFACQNIQEDTYKIYVNVTDIAGNMRSAQVNVTIDRTVPTITITKPEGLYVKNHTFNISGTTDTDAAVTVNGTDVNNDNGAFNHTLTLPDGTKMILVTATDEAGNEAVVSKEVIVDTVPPVIGTDLPATSAISFPGIRLQGTLTDATSGVQKLSVNGKNATIDVKNGTWTLDLTLLEGQNLLSFVASDKAGNVAKLERTVIVDSIAPVITITSPKGPYPIYTNKVDQTITGKVTEANLVSFTLNGKNVSVQPNGNFSVNVTLTVGSNKEHLEAKDISKTDSFFDVFLDVYMTAPTVVIISPANGLVTKAATVKVSVTVTDGSGGVVIMLRADRWKIMQDLQTKIFAGNANLTLGQNPIIVNATDKYGNEGTASVTVTYDNEAKLTLTKPTKTSVSTTTNSMTITGTSETGAKVYVNDVIIPVGTDGSFSYKLIVKEGKTTVTVKAVDLAGNEKTSTFTANYTNPKQFDLGTLLGLGIVLMIVGLLVGLVVGRMMAKPKAKPPMEEDEAGPEPEITKPAPKTEEPEETPFTPEEEPEETPAPPPPKVEPKVEPKPEPKPAPKPEPKPEPKPGPTAKPKPKEDDSLESLLSDLEKKKR
jgi:hypothetical protein